MRRILPLSAALSLSVLGTFSAVAQQTNPKDYNGSAACAQFKGTDRAIKCEIEQANLRIQQSKQRTNEATVVTDCTNFLLGGIKERKFTRDRMLETAGGKVNKDNACDV